MSSSLLSGNPGVTILTNVMEGSVCNRLNHSHYQATACLEDLTTYC
jgi:hypothetical protein